MKSFAKYFSGQLALGDLKLVPVFVLSTAFISTFATETHASDSGSALVSPAAKTSSARVDSAQAPSKNFAQNTSRNQSQRLAKGTFDLETGFTKLPNQDDNKEYQPGRSIGFGFHFNMQTQQQSTLKPFVAVKILSITHEEDTSKESTQAAVHPAKLAVFNYVGTVGVCATGMSGLDICPQAGVSQVSLIEQESRQSGLYPRVGLELGSKPIQALGNSVLRLGIHQDLRTTENEKASDLGQATFSIGLPLR